MSIENKLTYLDGTKQALKEAINNLGGDITSETTFREYAQELDQIYDNIPKTTDTGTNLSLNTIKGKMGIMPKGDTQQDTYSGKNLYPSGTSIQTIGGITFTPQADGGIKLQGTSTYANYYVAGGDGNYVEVANLSNKAENMVLSVSGMQNGIQVYVVGTNLGVQGVTNTDGTAKFTTIANDTYRIFIRVMAEYSVDTTLYIQLEKGNSATSFEKYVGGAASPNPTYPQNIEVVTGTQEVKVENVNLFDDTITPEAYYYNASGVKTASPSSSETYINQEIYLSNTAITISRDTRVGGASIRVCEYNGNTFIKRTLIETSPATITLDGNTTRVIFSINNSETQYLTNLQIEKGSTATPYTPHQEQTQTISLGDIELCKIGNYQDYLYKSGDKWYKKEQIGKYTFTGNEGWVYDSNNTRFNVNNVVHYANLEGRQQVYCNNFKYLSTGSGSYGIFGHYNSGYNTTFIYDTDYTSADNFKTWLASHNTYMYYITSTPQDIEITNETLISQLNNLEKMYSYNGITNISSNGNLPIVLGVSALKGE